MKRNYNSTVNQEIKSKLIGREVIACASVMISEFEETEKRDEIFELFYSEPDFETAIENWEYSASEEEIKEVLEYFEVSEIEQIDEYELVDHLQLDYDYLEPYEFWIVTDYFGEKLKEQGQIVEDFAGFTIWGRLTTGQAILLDYCISKIAEEMEILEGMSNSWEK